MSGRQPEYRREIFEKQREIGWGNFAMGRIHRGWCKYKKDTGNDIYLEDDEWGVRLITEILEMLTRKWKIRCDMMETEGKTKEEEKPRERCTERRKTIKEDDLL